VRLKIIWKAKNKVKLLVINVIVLLGMLLLLEVILQLLKPYNLYKRTYPGQIKDKTFDKQYIKVNWMKIDSSVGWVCSNANNLKFSNIFYNQFDIKYNINKQGYRSNFDFCDKNFPNKKKMMLLGDSFLFGWYLEYPHTLAGQLEFLDNDSRFFNFGIPGYGIDQMFMTFRKYYKLINPDVIILIYIDDDIPRILESYRFVEGLNKPSYKINSKGFEYRYSTDYNFIITLLHHSYIINKFYEKYLDYLAVSFTKKMIKQIKIESKKEILVVRWPRKEMLSWRKIDWYYDLSEFWNSNGIHYVNLADYFSDLPVDQIQSFYLAHDGHPSVSGNKFVAGLLNEEINKIINK